MFLIFVITGSGNGLAPNMGQAIAWACDDLYYLLGSQEQT